MYIVSFQWYDTDTYCTNLCSASDTSLIISHYEDKGCRVVGIRRAEKYEIESAKSKGMPVVSL